MCYDNFMKEKLEKIHGMIVDLDMRQKTFSEAFDNCLEDKKDMFHLLWLNQKISEELNIISNELDALATNLQLKTVA